MRVWTLSSNYERYTLPSEPFGMYSVLCDLETRSGVGRHFGWVYHQIRVEPYSTSPGPNGLQTANTARAPNSRT
jgi:hypothetical protein